MFRTARSNLRHAEAGVMRSLAHGRTNPSVICSTLKARPLSSAARHSSKYTPLATQSYFQRRQFSFTSSMANTRTESDAFGEIQVPSDKYWGAQTERSLENFKINQPQDRMPPPIVRAFGILKGASATVNMKFGLGMVIQAGSKLQGKLTKCRPKARKGHPASR
jgi:fumarate hydratase class II